MDVSPVQCILTDVFTSAMIRGLYLLYKCLYMLYMFFFSTVKH